MYSRFFTGPAGKNMCSRLFTRPAEKIIEKSTSNPETRERAITTSEIVVAGVFGVCAGWVANAISPPRGTVDDVITPEMRSYIGSGPGAS